MRVICLVPSLTETLIECGVNVVARTRFCIHPHDKVQTIEKVGGTKAVDWQKCAVLKPDIVVFDREENIKDMAESCPYPWAATHITSVENVGSELIKLASKLMSPELEKMGHDWDELANRPNLAFPGWDNIPGQIQSINNADKNYRRIEYIIWREPWMAIGSNTFIDSMLRKLGFSDYLPKHSQSYPQLEQGDMSHNDVFYLFSSEPFPFVRHHKELVEQGFNGAIVDGELYSWFGIRSYHGLLKAVK